MSKTPLRVQIFLSEEPTDAQYTVINEQSCSLEKTEGSKANKTPWNVQQKFEVNMDVELSKLSQEELRSAATDSLKQLLQKQRRKDIEIALGLKKIDIKSKYQQDTIERLKGELSRGMITQAQFDALKVSLI